MKRVVVIDESVLGRDLLRGHLEAVDGVEVPYTAPTLELGVSFLARNAMDLIVLDIEMAREDGLAAMNRLRATSGRTPVLVCSVDEELTLRALSEGASDFVPKPRRGASDEGFGDLLATKARGLLGLKSSVQPNVARLRPRPGRVVRPARVQALAIGCSTGGPAALAAFFAMLPELSLPLFIVQHMPTAFTSLLADRLSAVSGLVVKEAEDGEPVRPGVCYLAPGGRHTTVERDGNTPTLRLNDDPPENFCRPAVDVLFRGLANVYGGAVLASVLTGMGSDGALGCAALAARGARILIQTPSTCVVPSMPNAVKDQGVVDAEMDVSELGQAYAQVSSMNGMVAALARVGGTQ